MSTIVLSGFSCTGKSAVGRRLAERLGHRFVDMDVELQRTAARRSEEGPLSAAALASRQQEHRLLSRLFAEDGRAVVALGAEAVTSRALRHFIMDHAILVTLTASAETIVERLGERAGEAGNFDALARTRELLDERMPAYSECQVTLRTDGADPAHLAATIAELVERAPIAVPLGSRTYAVSVCHNAPSRVTVELERLAPSSLVIVSDEVVQRERHEYLRAALAPLDLPQVLVTLPAGEEHKTLSSAGAIWDAALGARIDRDAVVVAFGGGVVGDLAGFAASALLRGIRSLIVPTTLLSMVDASVGGKTGLDHSTGKNLLGAFYQPSGVVVDLGHLATLPARERTAGLAEIVKVALVADVSLLEALERDADAIVAGAPTVLLPIVRRAIEAKVRVVRDDERDRGTRMLLNLGHTVGHALETHGRYRKYLHGEAVALGLLAELGATARLGLTPQHVVERVRELLFRLGLPSTPDRAEVATAWRYVSADKKRVMNGLLQPIVSGVGESRVEEVTQSALREAVLGALD